MSNETLYPNGSAPRLVGENGPQIAGNGPPSDERLFPCADAGVRIIDLVKADLDARDRKGVETYGSSLRVDSANDALQYGYEEALDLAMYLRQEMARRANLPAATREELGALTAQLISKNANLRAELAAMQRERDELREAARLSREAVRAEELTGIGVYRRLYGREVDHRDVAEGRINAAWERLHRGFGWLNFPPRGLCICHLFQDGPVYDGQDDYAPPDDHWPECDSYNEALRILSGKAVSP